MMLNKTENFKGWLTKAIYYYANSVSSFSSCGWFETGWQRHSKRIRCMHKENITLVPYEHLHLFRTWNRMDEIRWWQQNSEADKDERRRHAPQFSHNDTFLQNQQPNTRLRNVELRLEPRVSVHTVWGKTLQRVCLSRRRKWTSRWIWWYWCVAPHHSVSLCTTFL